MLSIFSYTFGHACLYLKNVYLGLCPYFTGLFFFYIQFYEFFVYIDFNTF